jgi:hypothetical protein
MKKNVVQKKKGAKKVLGGVVYSTKNGAITLRGDMENETVWATQAEIAQIFDVTP